MKIMFMILTKTDYLESLMSHRKCYGHTITRHTISITYKGMGSVRLRWYVCCHSGLHSLTEPYRTTNGDSHTYNYSLW
jgi:hypothetical protein